MPEPLTPDELMSLAELCREKCDELLQGDDPYTTMVDLATKCEALATSIANPEGCYTTSIEEDQNEAG